MLGKSLKPLKPRQRLSPLRLCHYYHLRRDSPRRRTPESLPNPDPNPDCGLTESLVYSGSFTVTTAASTNTAVQGDGNGAQVAGNIPLAVLPTAAGTVTDGPTGTLTVAWLT